MNSYIRSVGSYLPEKIISNFDLENTLDTNDEWITQRTGIKQRHIVGDEQLTSDLAFHAAKQAIDQSNLDYADIDMIIVATTTSDRTFPSTATILQDKLGIKSCAAFDIQAVCSGFIYALSIADKFITTESAKNILVIGAESMSKIVDWSDRSTAILFGDGAGAVILSSTKEANKGIIDIKIQSDGSARNLLYTDGGIALNNKSGIIKMNGKELMKRATEKMSEAVLKLLSDNKYSVSDVNYIIPHQANSRIILNVANRLSIPEEKVIVTIDKHANTSAASIPLALDCTKSRFRPGDLIALTAFGGGLTWGACLIKW